MIIYFLAIVAAGLVIVESYRIADHYGEQLRKALEKEEE